MSNNKDLLKAIYYFNNACRNSTRTPDEGFLNKVREFLLNLKPNKMWEEVGVFNHHTKANLFPDFVIFLNDRIIACEAELQPVQKKLGKYDGASVFDEIWFFTDIHIEKKHLHYQFDNSLKIATKFFGINDVGQIVNIR